MKPNLSVFILAISLVGCSSTPPSRPITYKSIPSTPKFQAETRSVTPRSMDPRAQEVVLYALGLLDIGYRFGGKNPEAGFDCSGMVSYIYTQAVGIPVAGSAADIARRGATVPRDNLNPGDLVFFNTLGRPFSHVGIYIGDNRFIHAPNSRGAIRIERMDNSYFASRFETARSLFN